jgi:hypothetical protein
MPISGNTKSAFGHWRYKVVDETGATRAITPSDFGCIITNDEALTATLPTPIAAFRGAWVKFYTKADAAITLDCATADKLVVFNDATGSSIVNATAAHLIGDAYTALCNGSKWLISCHPGDEGITRTVG